MASSILDNLNKENVSLKEQLDKAVEQNNKHSLVCRILCIILVVLVGGISMKMIQLNDLRGELARPIKYTSITCTLEWVCSIHTDKGEIFLTYSEAKNIGKVATKAQNMVRGVPSDRMVISEQYADVLVAQCKYKSAKNDLHREELAKAKRRTFRANVEKEISLFAVQAEVAQIEVEYLKKQNKQCQYAIVEVTRLLGMGGAK